MAVTVTSSIRVQLNATQAAAVDLGTTQFPLRYLYSKALPSGTTTGKADKLFSDSRHLNASASEDLDLAGVLLDAFGVAISFVKVKAILVAASALNTNKVNVSPGSAAEFLGPFADASDIVSISPGGIFLVTAPAAGWAVVATTGDKLGIANSGAGTGVDYDIVILGTSA